MGNDDMYWLIKENIKVNGSLIKQTGEGVFKWPDGRKYIGYYKDDKKDGYGIFEWPDGQKYKGYQKQGKRHREGELYDPLEKIWKKEKWENGKDTNGNMLSADDIKSNNSNVNDNNDK